MFSQERDKSHDLLTVRVFISKDYDVRGNIGDIGKAPRSNHPASLMSARLWLVVKLYYRTRQHVFQDAAELRDCKVNVAIAGSRVVIDK